MLALVALGVMALVLAAWAGMASTARPIGKPDAADTRAVTADAGMVAAAHATGMIEPTGVAQTDGSPAAATRESRAAPVQSHRGRSKRRYRVLVMFPSDMADGELRVDGRIAHVVAATLVSKTIEVVHKQGNHVFTVQSGPRSCEQEQAIRKDEVKIYLCL